MAEPKGIPNCTGEFASKKGLQARHGGKHGLHITGTPEGPFPFFEHWVSRQDRMRESIFVLGTGAAVVCGQHVSTRGSARQTDARLALRGLLWLRIMLVGTLRKCYSIIRSTLADDAARSLWVGRRSDSLAPVGGPWP